MTTAADVIAQARQHLQSGQREEMNKLSASYTAGGTALSFTYDMRSINRGSYLDVGLELFYVWAVAGQTATVDGAQLGSTAANHAPGDLVVVNPKFPTFTLLQRLNDELADLSSPTNGLFQVKTVSIAVSGTTRGYNLATDVLGVLDVRYPEVGGEKSYPKVTGWQILRNVPTSDFASGVALRLDEHVQPGRTLTVSYKAPFTGLSALATDVTTTGLPATATDILSLGVAIRAMAGREVKRNFTEGQPDTRRAEDVPPGAVDNSSAGLRRLRRDRIQAEVARLYAQWGLGT